MTSVDSVWPPTCNYYQQCKQGTNSFLKYQVCDDVSMSLHLTTNFSRVGLYFKSETQSSFWWKAHREQWTDEGEVCVSLCLSSFLLWRPWSILNCVLNKTAFLCFDNDIKVFYSKFKTGMRPGRSACAFLPVCYSTLTHKTRVCAHMPACVRLMTKG